ncbi:MAG: shikimate kinase [Candidatus Nanopelagicaceae bacterium]
MAPRLVLIGPMGAGKTTIGSEIANKLKLTFADTDALIENDQGKSVSEIFVEDGEPHFRLVEESVVIDALIAEEGVLSLGGGAVMNAEVAKALKSSPAKKVFLDISLAAVSPRVGFDNARPLLMVNPRQKWSELMNLRRPTYESLADLTIDVSEKSVSEITDEIIGVL